METPRDTKTGCGTKPKLQEPLYFQVEVLAIPAEVTEQAESTA
jgi:hypothetical protein